MKDYKRLTEKKEITECEIVSDKRYSVGFKQIPHKINRNIIRGAHTICNDMDGQGDYIVGDIVDKIADLEDKIESGELVDRNAYLDYLMAAKNTLELTDKEIEFFIKHNARVRENTDAELRARIDNAIGLPCVKMVKDRVKINMVSTVDIIWEWTVIYRDRQGDLVVEPCSSKAAAEARLAELKGGRE